MFGPHSVLRSSPCRFLTTLLLIAGMSVSAAPPVWWTTPDSRNFRVIDPAVTDSNPFGPANVGQGKYLAKRALEALSAAVGENAVVKTQVVAAIEQELYKTEENSPTGVFYPVVPDEPTLEWLDAQKVPLQIGAMKAMAAPFYRHLSAMNANWVRNQLIANGLTLGSGFFQDSDGTYFPWNPADNTSSVKNRAPATIGQLKVVFSLRFEVLDIDGDGIVDSTDQNGDGVPDSAQDSDGDGLTDAQEYALRTDPKKADTDDDGLTDAEELQRGTKPTVANTDGDDLKDGEDADPLDRAINWKLTPEPRYAFLEIDDWDPVTHGSPIMTNKKGQLLCQQAVWKDEEWTQIQTDVVLTNTYHGEPIKLYGAVATSIDDIGAIAGYATGRTFLSYSYWGSLPLVWNTATDSTPIAVGVPDTLPDYIIGDYDATAYIARNGQVMTVPHYQTNSWLLMNSMFHYDWLDPNPVGSALAPSQFGGMGRDGSSCGRTFDPEYLGDTEPWTWLGPEPQTYAELNSSNTTNPDPFTGNIDFNTDIQTMGTTPPAGPTATAQERPAVNLGGQTLIYNGQKWVKSQSLQYASALSASGTAITNDFGDPAVWRNGKVTKLKDLCTGLTEEGITDFNTIDINDEGVILIRIPAEIPFVDRIALLIPAAVVEVSPKTKDENNNDIAGSEKPNSGLPLTPFVEEDPENNRIAHREIKVKVCEALKDKKVTWSLEALPGATPATIRGQWEDSETHEDRFEQSTAYTGYWSRRVSQTSGETTIGADGYTAIRVNVPPIGFNQVRIKIQIEGTSTPSDLINMEVPGVVVIDPGHGGTTNLDGSNANNATANPSGILEKAMALDYGLALRGTLRQYRQTNRLNLQVFTTRHNDQNLEGSFRANLARDKGADVFVSIHFNATNKQARGSEALIRGTNQVNGSEVEDERLGRHVLDGVLAGISQFDNASSDRGVKNYAWSNTLKKNVLSSWAVLSDDSYANDDDYHPVRGTIAEIEFIDVPAVDALLNTGANAGAVMSAVVNGMRDGILNDLIQQPTP